MEIATLIYWIAIGCMTSFVVAAKSENTRDFGHNELHHAPHLMLDNIMLSSDNVDNGQLVFHPKQLDFGSHSVGEPHSLVVTIYNKHMNKSVFLGTVSSTTPDFYSSFFEERIIQPMGNTTFSVVFLPRQHGAITGTFNVQTSFGVIQFNMTGIGMKCPFRLRPLVGLKAPFNTTLTPEITLFNPHSHPIHILEVYSSGGQFQLELSSEEKDESQTRWEIPPYTTKSIIRVRFTATTPGNHTAYIRIRVSDGSPDVNERLLVVPIEVEIQSSTGIYSTIPFLNFGTSGTEDQPKEITFKLLNSGKDVIDIRNAKIEASDQVKSCVSVRLRRELNERIGIVTVNWSKLSQTTLLMGTIVIKSTVLGSEQIYRIPFVGEAIQGGFTHDTNLTKFIITAAHKNQTNDFLDYRTNREIVFENKFLMPIHVINITISKLCINNFHIKHQVPAIVQPGDKVTLLEIQRRENATMEPIAGYAWLTTNITAYEIAIFNYDGLLIPMVPVETGIVTLVEEGGLNFGTLPISTSGDMLFGLLNENPVKIKINSWKAFVSSAVKITVRLRGCGNLKKIDLDHFTLCDSIKPGEWMVFQISVISNSVGSYNGKFILKTDFEEINTPIKLNSAMGRLDLDHSLLQFKGCFPGSSCELKMIAHSTFLKSLQVTNIQAPSGVVYSIDTVSEYPVIKPNVETYIGNLVYSPKYKCHDNCYVSSKMSTSSFTSAVDQDLLVQRIKMFQDVKSTPHFIPFRVTTDQVKCDFNASVEYVWPKMIDAPVVFPPLQVGHEVIKFINVHNPSKETVKIGFSLFHPMYSGFNIDEEFPPEIITDCPHCALSESNNFRLISAMNNFRFDEAIPYEVIPPKQSVKIPIIFDAEDTGVFSTILFMPNNLTIIEAAWITARAVRAQLKIGNRDPGSDVPLSFEFTDKHIRECEKPQSERQRNGRVAIKRTFTLKNTGEVPIIVSDILIGRQSCEGYGFHIKNCSPFELVPNATKSLEFIFIPDFTLLQVIQTLSFETSLDKDVNFTLFVTIPNHAYAICGGNIERPVWEFTMKIVSAVVLFVALICVFFAAKYDSDNILKDHVDYMTREKGPVQPALDFRQLGNKSSYNDESPNKECSRNSNNKSKKSYKKYSPIANEVYESVRKNWVDELTNSLSSFKGKKSNGNHQDVRKTPSPNNNNASKSAHNSVKKDDHQKPPDHNKGDRSKKQSDLNDKEVEDNLRTFSADSGDSESSKSESSTPSTARKSISPVESNKKAEHSSGQKSSVKKTKSPSTSNYDLTPGSSSSAKGASKHSQPHTKSTSSMSHKDKDNGKRKFDGTKVTSSSPPIPISRENIPPESNNVIDSNELTPKTNTNTNTNTGPKKYGKTPGRERKRNEGKGRGQPRDLLNRLNNTSLTETTTCTWTSSQQTFSSVVAQNPGPSFTQDNQLTSEIRSNELMNQFRQPYNGFMSSSTVSGNVRRFPHDNYPVTNDRLTRSMDLGPIGSLRSGTQSHNIWNLNDGPSLISDFNPNSFFSEPFPQNSTTNSRTSPHSYSPSHNATDNNSIMDRLETVRYPSLTNQMHNTVYNPSVNWTSVNQNIQNQPIYEQPMEATNTRRRMAPSQYDNMNVQNPWGTNTVWSSDYDNQNLQNNWARPSRPPPGLSHPVRNRASNSPQFLTDEHLQQNERYEQMLRPDSIHTMPEFQLFNSQPIWSNQDLEEWPSYLQSPQDDHNHMN